MKGVQLVEGGGKDGDDQQDSHGEATDDIGECTLPEVGVEELRSLGHLQVEIVHPWHPD